MILKIRNQEKKIVVEYMKAIDSLTIDKSVVLARENQELREKAEGTEELKKQIRDLKRELFEEMDIRLGIKRKRLITDGRILERDNWVKENWTSQQMTEYETMLDEVREDESNANRLENDV